MITKPERDSSKTPQSNEKVLKEIISELVQIRKSLSGWKSIKVSKKEPELSQESKKQNLLPPSKEDPTQEDDKQKNSNILKGLKSLFDRLKNNATKSATKGAGEAAGKVATKGAGEAVAKTAGKTAGKTATKGIGAAIGKQLAKRLPLFGSGVKLFSGVKDFFNAGAVKTAEKSGAKALEKIGIKTAEKSGAKALGKIGAKTAGKSALKKIPLFGLGAGLIFGAERFLNGDILGGFGEILSGAASIIPGIGTAASVAIDVGLGLRDVGAFGSETKDVPEMAAGGIVSQPTLALIGENKEKEYIIPESKLGIISNNIDSPLKDIGNDILGVSSNYVSQFGSSKLLPYIGSDLIQYQRIYGANREIIPIFTNNEGKFPDLKSNPLIDVFNGTKQNSNEGVLLASLNNVLDALDSSSSSLGLGQKNNQTSPSGKSNFSGSGNAEKVFNFFVSKGFEPFQAAAFVGNFVVESGSEDINPTAVGDNGNAFGIAQWNSRRPQLYEFASKNNKPVDSLETQLEFAWYEMQNKESSAYEAIKNTKTLEEATYVIMDRYERPGEPHLDKRQEASKRFYERIKNNPPSGKSSSISSSTSGSNISSASGDVAYPVGNPVVTSGFGWRTHPVTGEKKFHNGVDFGLDEGTPVYASESGVVDSAGWNDGGYGNMIELKGSQFKHVYAHLSSFEVKTGDSVMKGQKIGEVGSTGRSTGPHLHWEVLNLNTDDPLDPLDVVGKGSSNSSYSPSNQEGGTDNLINSSPVDTSYLRNLFPSFGNGRGGGGGDRISSIQKSQGSIIAFVPIVYSQNSPSSNGTQTITNLSPELSSYISLNQFTPQTPTV